MVLEELLKCGDLSVCCGKCFYLRITDKVFHLKKYCLNRLEKKTAL